MINSIKIVIYLCDFKKIQINQIWVMKNIFFVNFFSNFVENEIFRTFKIVFVKFFSYSFSSLHLKISISFTKFRNFKEKNVERWRIDDDKFEISKIFDEFKSNKRFFNFDFSKFIDVVNYVFDNVVAFSNVVCFENWIWFEIKYIKMFFFEIESMKINYNLFVKRHNRKKHNVLHQIYFNEINRFNFFKKL